MKKDYVMIVLLFIVISCKDMGVELPSESEQDDLRESVYRFQMAGSDTSRIYFLATVELNPATGRYVMIDPSDSFIDRFKDMPCHIKKYSDCDYHQGVTDKATGRRGMILRTERIQWLSRTEVYIYGGYEENGLSASGNRFRVQFVSGKWTVTENILIWIS